MRRYTMKLPPEMNNKKYRKIYNELEGIMAIPLDGEFSIKEKEEDIKSEITH